jgi:hypothetical protein
VGVSGLITPNSSPEARTKRAAKFGHFAAVSFSGRSQPLRGHGRLVRWWCAWEARLNPWANNPRARARAEHLAHVLPTLCGRRVAFWRKCDSRGDRIGAPVGARPGASIPHVVRAHALGWCVGAAHQEESDGAPRARLVVRWVRSGINHKCEHGLADRPHYWYPCVNLGSSFKTSYLRLRGPEGKGRFRCQGGFVQDRGEARCS